MATTTATRTDAPASTDGRPPANEPPMAKAGGRLSSATGAAASAAGAVASAASDVAARLPDLTDRGLTAFDHVNRRIQSGSDATLATGAAVSFGFAAGLLIGGASRILVAVALVPVAMMGLTLLDRATNSRLGHAL
jgi:hypothetical protein